MYNVKTFLFCGVLFTFFSCYLKCSGVVYCRCSFGVGSVIYKISELDLSRAMRKGVFKGKHRNDNHHIDLGIF